MRLTPDGDLGTPEQVVCSDVHPEVAKPTINMGHLGGSEVARSCKRGQMIGSGW